MSQRNSLTRAMSAILLLVGLLVIPSNISADVFFGHDAGTTGVAPPPANAVFAFPDVADIFFTPILINNTPGPNLGNTLAANNPAFLGLLPGDNVDAIHMELRPLGDPSQGTFTFSPTFNFTPDQGALGQPGTPIALQAPVNSGDLYQWTGFGQHVLSLNENQIGLAPAATEDVDSFLLTPLSVGTPPNSGSIFFSLTPGSPTLAALGASAADILSAPAGGGGPAIVSITASQLGLASDDDVDGLIMLEGTDANADGDFNDPGDIFPWVNFSVSGGSQGLVTTAVANQVATDPPIGGDIFFSLGGGQNALFFDDGATGLGLADTDNLNGLDLPEMAIFPGLPGSTPFTAGPVIPGGGGGGGCINAVRFSVCAGGFGNTKITVGATISCNGGAAMPAGNSPQMLVVPCNNANVILQAILGMLRNMTGPPPANIPIFAPGVAIAGTPAMASGTINVNPGFAASGCKLVSVSVSWTPPCITISMALKSVAVNIPVDNFTVIQGDVTQGGAYMLQLTEDDAQITIPFTPGVTAEEAVQEVVAGLTDLGFVVEAAGNQFSIISRPDGEQLIDFYATGLVDTDFTGAEFTYSWPFVPPCHYDLNADRVVDFQDMAVLKSRFGPVEDGLEEPADFNGDGFVDQADMEILLENQGACPDPIDVHADPGGLSTKPLDLNP